MRTTILVVFLEEENFIGKEFTIADFAKRREIFEKASRNNIGEKKPVEIEIDTEESEQIKSLRRQKFDELVNFDDSTFANDKLSFAIEKDDLRRISNSLLQLVKNPESLKYLSKLDSEIDQELKAQKVVFPKDNKPQYLIASHAVFVPGPPPPGYKLAKKNDILDQILLKKEMAAGVNLSGVTPRFIGFVDSDHADDFVSKGNIFSEDEQVGTLLHGKYSHRLFLEIVREAQKAGVVDLKLKSGEVLTPKQVLELLVKTETQRNPVRVARGTSLIENPDAENFYIKKFKPRSLWEALIDSVEEVVTHPYFGISKFAAFNPENYSFNLRSPFAFKSLMICFGEKFGLENLQKYMLDSHWKQMNKIENRILKAFELEPTDPENRRKVRDFAVCVLSTFSDNPGTVPSGLFPVTASSEELKAKYGVPNTIGITFKDRTPLQPDLPKSKL